MISYLQVIAQFPIKSEVTETLLPVCELEEGDVTLFVSIMHQTWVETHSDIVSLVKTIIFCQVIVSSFHGTFKLIFLFS